MYPKEDHLAPYETPVSIKAEKWMREQIGEKRYSVKRISTFADLKDLLEQLRQDSAGLVFRGQACWRWKLYSKYERTLQHKETVGENHGRSRSFPAGKIFDPALNFFKKNIGISENEHQWDGQLVSLLQHYGAPTTFLDWTESVDIALFFAACFAAPPKTKYATIFVINSQRVNTDLKTEEGNRSPFFSKIFKATRFFDLRIRAQKGLFSAPPIGGLYGLFPAALDRAIKVATNASPKQVLVKIHFDRKLCHQIKQDLRTREVTWETVFPPASMEDLCRVVEQQVFNEINATSDFE